MTLLQGFIRLAREHRVILAITLLIALVAFTGWRRLMVDDTESGVPAPAINDTDYMLRDFTLTLINENGEQGLKLTAATMQHHPEKMRSEYKQPHVVLFEDGQASWSGHAESGWAGDDRREILLTGSVALERLTGVPSNALTLHTERLRLYPQDERATSDAEVRLNQPGAQIRGTGMTLDLKQQRYRLKANVQGHYAITDST